MGAVKGASSKRVLGRRGCALSVILQAAFLFGGFGSWASCFLADKSGGGYGESVQPAAAVDMLGRLNGDAAGRARLQSGEMQTILNNNEPCRVLYHEEEAINER